MQHHINKKIRRAKTREKFDLITKILPEIAKKSAKMLEKPVPILDEVITKIMDVVWIEDVIEYEKVQRPPVQMKLLEDSPVEKQREGTITKSRILIINYKKGNLYL